MTLTPDRIAQWIIDNRYPKSELEKISDHEMYHYTVEKITELMKESFSAGHDSVRYTANVEKSVQYTLADFLTNR